jgi:hypothetical protein
VRVIPFEQFIALFVERSLPAFQKVKAQVKVEIEKV